MGYGGELVVELIVMLIFGVAVAAVANSKGRNTVGWFFLGFLFALFALIIVLCLSNLKEDEARWDAQAVEQRRMRERLRQEQMKNEALRQHTVARLDQHDEMLEINTRNSSPGLNLPPASQGGMPAIPVRATTPPAVPTAVPPVASPPAGFPATNWYISEGNQRQGPYSYEMLHSRARQGALPEKTLVWVEGMDGWREADLVPGLLS